MTGIPPTQRFLMMGRAAGKELENQDYFSSLILKAAFHGASGAPGSLI